MEISLHFFQFLVDKFTLLDLDPHIECGSRSRRENECGSGSGSTALKKTLFNILVFFYDFLLFLGSDLTKRFRSGWIRVRNTAQEDIIFKIFQNLLVDGFETLVSRQFRTYWTITVCHDRHLCVVSELG